MSRTVHHVADEIAGELEYIADAYQLLREENVTLKERIEELEDELREVLNNE